MYKISQMQVLSCFFDDFLLLLTMLHSRVLYLIINNMAIFVAVLAKEES
jgi:hypothetical protein